MSRSPDYDPFADETRASLDFIESAKKPEGLAISLGRAAFQRTLDVMKARRKKAAGSTVTVVHNPKASTRRGRSGKPDDLLWEEWLSR